MITMIILLNGCVKKDQNLSKKFSSNSTIISMTVTHSNKQNDSFQSDIILLDTKDNSTDAVLRLCGSSDQDQEFLRYPAALQYSLL